ncbi:hypothetical protein [Amycolatopsis sp. lyj-84]|uniref:hypothetical protein n=1 Tax=Amycolatopsis sp. lyj-84 TaxID=2789284 RepID=UPI00397A264F
MMTEVAPVTGADARYWSVPDRAREDTGPGDESTIAVLVAVLSATPGARGLWRTRWVDLSRSGADGETETRYIALAESRALPALADTVRLGGDAAVEVVSADGDMPRPTRTALASGTLLWAADPAPVLKVARVFDGVQADGTPFFLPGHPELAGAPEVLEYLRAATTLLTTPDTMDDVWEPGRGRVVPMNFRTDGTWIWPDTVEYYLEEHGLAPESRLLAHVHAAGDRPPRLDQVAAHRAMTELFRQR